MEPVPVTIPDDAAKSEPTLPNPEGEPKGGIKVEYRQPDLLHKIAKNQVDGKSPFGTDISYTRWNDSFIRGESTQLIAFNENRGRGPRIDGTFSYSSNIYLADERVARPDHGYYSQEMVRGIHEALQQKGINVTTHFNRGLYGGRSSIVIEKNGYYVEVHFGLPSRDAEEAQIRAEVEADRKKRPDEPGYMEKYELPRIEEGLKHKLISLHLVDKEDAETGWEGYPRLQSQTEFEQATVVYTEAYQQVFEALYRAEGLTPPNETVILRPPILNQDALTEVASVEVASPIHLVETQTIPELTSFDEIAGQDAAVAEAKRLVLAINNPEIFERRGVKRPKGILFYGPPGTGKTLIAKAVAEKSHAVFLEVSAADIGTKWYGEAERLMQEVFNKANRSVSEGNKVVIFFDELDSLAPSREDAHESTRKVVATLLQNVDGMKANPNVTIIAATNRPQDIDPALKRPGRIDKLIEVGLPNTEGREAILKVHMAKAKKAATLAGELFDEGVVLSQVSQATPGMSGADLANLINLTLEDKTMAEIEGVAWTPITTEELLATARKLGMLKEEKRRIGFVIPERPRQNDGTQANIQSGTGE